MLMNECPGNSGKSVHQLLNDPRLQLVLCTLVVECGHMHAACSMHVHDQEVNSNHTKP